MAESASEGKIQNVTVTEEKGQEKIVDFKGGSSPEDKHSKHWLLPDSLWCHTVPPQICAVFTLKKYMCKEPVMSILPKDLVVCVCDCYLGSKFHQPRS